MGLGSRRRVRSVRGLRRRNPGLRHRMRDHSVFRSGLRDSVERKKRSFGTSVQGRPRSEREDQRFERRRRSGEKLRDLATAEIDYGDQRSQICVAW